MLSKSTEAFYETFTHKCHDWHRLDTFLSHHYFVIDRDEDDVGGIPENDAIEIEVQGLSKASADAVPGSTGPQELFGYLPQSAERPSAYFAWFMYHKLKGSGAVDITQPPLKVDQDWALQELLAWFHPARGLLRPAPGSPVAAPVGRVVIRAVDDQLTLQDSRDEHSSAVGAVVACDLLKFLDEDAQNPSKNRKYVLRVSVLETPWERLCVRIRLRRNARDIDGDFVEDIDPGFIMESAQSSWSVRPAGAIVFDPARFARMDAPKAASYLVADLTREEWISLPLAPPSNHDEPSGARLGPMISRVLNATFLPKGGGPNLPYWGPEGLSADHVVSGTVLQVLQDRHVTVGQTLEGLSARDDLIARQNLVVQGAPVPANRIDELTWLIRKDLVMSANLLITLVWRKSGQPTLLEITWPVKFKGNYAGPEHPV